MGNHALIFGATGIQGWAVTRELLNGYPSPSAFDRITALTNRPITGEMLWPESDKLQVVSGIDLLGDNVDQEMKERVPDITGVTHVFFFAYIYKENPDEEIAINVELLKKAISSIESLSTKLKFVLLPTGTKAYGVHLLDQFPFADKLPLSEDLPRIPEPFASQNFYYNQTDWLEAASKTKEWTWCEIRPDVVIGFVPNNNVYCLAQTLATYLACYREVEGDGAECAFPGTEMSWKALSNDSDQDTIARFSIHGALHPETCGQGQAFNVASNSKASSWSEKWPVICEFFGLKGTPPPPHGSGPQPGQYLNEHLEQWQALERKHGLVTGRVGNDRSLATFQHFIMTLFNFDRSLDLGRQNQAWGEAAEEKDSKRVWWTAFQRFRDAKIIP
ncbi:Short chain dehydrogenase sirQ [Pseudocercospora fuligena]|uniref:Short chain dehydrogenase sirQ n=1 Tax=Pseudocercospora fuligena TaxID=685502 RepID=A0A8H6R5X2_9PEZI|nr:Short chain dehydrogenase sirQ [Pseudocercospora fuligena]